MKELTRDDILIKTDDLIKRSLSTLNIASKVYDFFRRSQQHHLYKERLELNATDNPGSLEIKLAGQRAQIQFVRNLRLVRNMCFEIEDRAREALK